MSDLRSFYSHHFCCFCFPPASGKAVDAYWQRTWQALRAQPAEPRARKDETSRLASEAPAVVQGDGDTLNTICDTFSVLWPGLLLLVARCAGAGGSWVAGYPLLEPAVSSARGWLNACTVTQSLVSYVLGTFVVDWTRVAAGLRCTHYSCQISSVLAEDSSVIVVLSPVLTALNDSSAGSSAGTEAAGPATADDFSSLLAVLARLVFVVTNICVYIGGSGRHKSFRRTFCCHPGEPAQAAMPADSSNKRLVLFRTVGIFATLPYSPSPCIIRLRVVRAKHHPPIFTLVHHSLLSLTGSSTCTLLLQCLLPAVYSGAFSLFSSCAADRLND